MNTPEHPKALEIYTKLFKELDKPTCVFSGQDKMAILLTVAGIKPASAVSLGYYPENEPDYLAKKNNDVEKAKDLLTKLGLKIVYEENHYEEDEEDAEPERFICSFYISNNSELAEEMKQAFNEGADEKIGELLGIPLTARKAFIKNSILPQDVPDLVQVTPEYKVSYFLLSQEHYKEELRFLKEKVLPLVEKYLPHEYKELTQRKPE